MVISIDLNADMGESFGAWSMGDDESLLSIVTSANIACGFHAGDFVVMERTISGALERGVSIGAHPGFPDLQGFGRRRMYDFSASELRSMIIYQVGALQALARSCGGEVSHVKLHGALANMSSASVDMSDIYMGAVKSLGDGLHVMAMACGELERGARRHGLPCIVEIFADRSYESDGSLTPRSESDAIIVDRVVAGDRILRILEDGVIISRCGVRIAVSPESICVHGDGEDAVGMAGYLRERLESAGIVVESYLARLARAAGAAKAKAKAAKVENLEGSN